MLFELILIACFDLLLLFWRLDPFEQGCPFRGRGFAHSHANLAPSPNLLTERAEGGIKLLDLPLDESQTPLFSLTASCKPRSDQDSSEPGARRNCGYPPIHGRSLFTPEAAPGRRGAGACSCGRRWRRSCRVLLIGAPFECSQYLGLFLRQPSLGL